MKSKCVGCLKCALFAEKTFAVESVYGKARVVAQWADPEDKIQEAIEACPVDCISFVERSNLAALEFLMSKQPRGNVRVGAGNTGGGTRVSNIFVDVEKFQGRFTDAMDKAKQHSKESDPQREAQMSAIHAIRSISNWLYWQTPSPSAGRPTSLTPQNLIASPQKSTEPNIKKLRDAVAARKQARENTNTTCRISSNYMYNDEYWIRSNLTLPEANHSYAGSRAVSDSTHNKKLNGKNKEEFVMKKNTRSNPFIWGVPMGTAAVAAVKVLFQVGQGTSGGLKEHIGGSLALDIINSS
ncbi:hypothetical protein F0562_023954 [Nyssa sinensis]|uniref:Uncharacterized protein n=1 Tax=Nyssa sinensis TaxID=561372 RepID=A0A5J5BM56_9ASTE|nr:hypothetical protein F0562_023954 [Nyssa sinensis]